MTSAKGGMWAGAVSACSVRGIGWSVYVLYSFSILASRFRAKRLPRIRAFSG
jgi:hypothetical protein